MADISLTSRKAWNLVERIEAWLSAWRSTLREVRAQSELRRKLDGVDDHLLRDMGLRWSGRHFERIGEEDWR